MKRFIFIPGGITGFWVGGTGRSKKKHFQNYNDGKLTISLLFFLRSHSVPNSTQPNSTQPNSTQPNSTQHNPIQLKQPLLNLTLTQPNPTQSNPTQPNPTEFNSIIFPQQNPVGIHRCCYQ